KDLPPGLADISGKKDAGSGVHIRALLAPGGQVHAPVVSWVQSQTVGTVATLREVCLGPVFRRVRGPKERAAAGFSIAAFVVARQDQVERPVVSPDDSPGEWFGLRNAAVLQHPGLSVVRRFVDAPSEAAGIEGAAAGRTGGIEQHMCYGGLGHTGIRRGPVPAAVGRNAHSANIGPGVSVAPHLGPRQIVYAAKRAPDQAAHLGIERQPVSRVPPLSRNAIGRGLPGGASVVAVKGAYVGVIDENVPRVERVEVDAVVGSHVEAASGPPVAAS